MDCIGKDETSSALLVRLRSSNIRAHKRMCVDGMPPPPSQAQSGSLCERMHSHEGHQRVHIECLGARVLCSDDCLVSMPYPAARIGLCARLVRTISAAVKTLPGCLSLAARSLRIIAMVSSRTAPDRFRVSCGKEKLSFVALASTRSCVCKSHVCDAGSSLRHRGHDLSRQDSQQKIPSSVEWAPSQILPDLLPRWRTPMVER